MTFTWKAENGVQRRAIPAWDGKIPPSAFVDGPSGDARTVCPFLKACLGGINDSFIQPGHQLFYRCIRNRREDPILVRYPEVLEHREGLLSFFDDRGKRDHALRDDRMKFKRR